MNSRKGIAVILNAAHLARLPRVAFYRSDRDFEERFISETIADRVP
jgi:hypothetical protein